jgi:futalosine hydrolase
MAVAATQMEMQPFVDLCRGEGISCERLVSGVGPLETAVTLSRFLAECQERVSGLVQFGVGGAYIVPNPEEQVPLLAVCLAESEVMGDLGICYPDRVEYFPDDLSGHVQFPLRSAHLTRAAEILDAYSIGYHSGAFVTVNSVSGTSRRGEMLGRHWQALCENMEGAAAARLCVDYSLPLVEIRVISNLVEERNRENWRLREACQRAAELAVLLVKEL